MELKQFAVFKDIFTEMEVACHVYGADVLLQLSRTNDGMLSYEEIFHFFRNRRRPIIWETLMQLMDQGMIRAAMEKDVHSAALTAEGSRAVRCMLLWFYPSQCVPTVLFRQMKEG